MIVYDRLWKTLKHKGITQYTLVKDFKFSQGTLDSLRKNRNVNTYTLNMLCRILDCDLSDIAEYVKDIEEVWLVIIMII